MADTRRSGCDAGEGGAGPGQRRPPSGLSHPEPEPYRIDNPQLIGIDDPKLSPINRDGQSLVTDWPFL